MLPQYVCKSCASVKQQISGIMFTQAKYEEIVVIALLKIDTITDFVTFDS